MRQPLTDTQPAPQPRPQPGSGPPAPAGWRRAGPPPVFSLLLSAFLLLVYSRAIELIPVRGLLMLLGIALLGGAVVTGRWMRAVFNAPTALLVAMSILMLPSAALGLWPGGSVLLLVDTWSRSVLIYFVVVSFVQDLQTLRRAVATLAFAMSVIVVMGIFLGVEKFGRMAINTGTLLNPNDLATVLVVGLPFCVYYMRDRQRSRLGRLIMAPTVIGVLIILMRTGSRAGFLGLVGVGLVLVFLTRGKTRLLFVTAGLACVIITGAVLSSGLVQRYQTIVSSEVETEADDSTQQEEDTRIQHAIGSSTMRWKLFLISLRVTFYNPLFGVGPGNFGVAAAETTREAGEKPIWQQSHNAVTQVSSECGVLAAALFLALIMYCIRITHRIRKSAAASQPLRVFAPLALCLFTAVTGWTICATFSSIAYLMHLPLLAALVVALQSSYRAAASDAALEPPPPARQPRQW